MISKLGLVGSGCFGFRVSGLRVLESLAVLWWLKLVSLGGVPQGMRHGV